MSIAQRTSWLGWGVTTFWIGIAPAQMAASTDGPYSSPTLGTRAVVDAGGRFFIPERPVGTTLTIDCATADWPGSALSVSLTGPVTGTIKMLVRHPDDAMADDTLYLLATINDNTSADSPPDRIVFIFDLYHDHVAPTAVSWIAADNRGIRFTRDNTVTRVYNSPVSPTADENAAAFPGTRKCITGNGVADPIWTVEAALVPSDLGLNAFNGVMGMAVVASDLHTGLAVNGLWPSTATTVASTWANVLTRQPIDFILLLDQSGSMWGDKWSSAKQAGNNFALVLSRTIDTELNAEFPLLMPAFDRDRLGLSVFTSALPGFAKTQIPLADISAAPGNFTGTLPANPGGATPIARGLDTTFRMFGGVGTFGQPRTRVVMLLSDGIHNTPNSTINFTPPSNSDLDYVPNPCGNNALVRVNTVAVGTDATVDVTKLNQIKSCYSGSTFTTPDGSTVNIYSLANPAEGQLTAQLTRFFVNVIKPYYLWNVINETGADFTINAGDRKLLLFAFWANKADAVDLQITKPDMSVATGSHDATLGYSWLTIDDPPSGQYTNFQALNAAARVVLVDLRVRTDFAVDNRPHGTGGTILLRARLRDGGRPVSGADVRVDIARPGEGFGTYTSTHTLNSCAALDPVLPPPTGGEGLTLAAVGGVAGQPDSTGDVKPPAFALIDALFKKCGKAGLTRTTDPGQQLVDDGTHGDAMAGDGIYSLAIDQTHYEGSYVFRFRTSGQTSDGQSFARIHETGTYVFVSVDPGSSPTGSRVVQTVGNIVTQEFFVLPRDRGGEYMGPGHADRVAFQLSGGGAFIGPVRDYNNGYYTRTLRYDRSQDRPTVTPTVDGKSIRISFKPWEFVLPFVGYTRFDNALGLDDGVVGGAKLGYRLTPQFTFEVEGGATFTKNSAGESGRAIQTLGNIRWDITPLRFGSWVPHVTAGAGYMLFRGFSVTDEALLYQAGVGATLQRSPSMGARIDVRTLRIADVLGVGQTTNYQATVGLVWWF